MQSAVAKGLQSAGSNRAGAGQAYMAMGMGMQGAGNFMASASATNAQQMQQQAAAQAAPANGWTCTCGTVNSGNFCTNCGGKKPGACRHLEVQLRRREHRQFLHQLRQQETGAVRRMEVQLPARRIPVTSAPTAAASVDKCRQRRKHEYRTI